MSHDMEQILAESYCPRNHRDSDYYRCTQDHFKHLEMVWDDQHGRRFGFWRPLTDRRLLCKLSRCASRVLSLCLKETVAYDDAMAGAAMAVHTFADINGCPSLRCAIESGFPEPDPLDKMLYLHRPLHTRNVLRY